MKEIESKIIEIDQKQVEARLAVLGAVHEFTALFEAAYFDGPGAPLRAKGQVLRLRREGDVNVFTFKYPVPNENPSVKVREELEMRIDDHATAWKILEGLGYQPTLIMNKTRSQWRLGASHIVIDQYVDAFAHIPAFLEIESPSIVELEAAASALGFAPSDLKNWSASELIAYYAGK